MVLKLNLRLRLCLDLNRFLLMIANYSLNSKHGEVQDIPTKHIKGNPSAARVLEAVVRELSGGGKASTKNPIV